MSRWYSLEFMGGDAYPPQTLQAPDPGKRNRLTRPRRRRRSRGRPISSRPLNSIGSLPEEVKDGDTLFGQRPVRSDGSSRFSQRRVRPILVFDRVGRCNNYLTDYCGRFGRCRIQQHLLGPYAEIDHEVRASRIQSPERTGQLSQAIGHLVIAQG